jgi:hypothetical protein
MRAAGGAGGAASGSAARRNKGARARSARQIISASPHSAPAARAHLSLHIPRQRRAGGTQTERVEAHFRPPSAAAGVNLSILLNGKLTRAVNRFLSTCAACGCLRVPPEAADDTCRMAYQTGSFTPKRSGAKNMGRIAKCERRRSPASSAVRPCRPCCLRKQAAGCIATSGRRIPAWLACRRRASRCSVLAHTPAHPRGALRNCRSQLACRYRSCVLRATARCSGMPAAWGA